MNVVIRWASAGDEPALAALAALDSRRRPPGELLVADCRGEIVAAVTADGRQAIADPFRRTTRVLQALRARAAEVRGEDSGSGRTIPGGLRPAAQRRLV